MRGAYDTAPAAEWGGYLAPPDAQTETETDPRGLLSYTSLQDPTDNGHPPAPAATEIILFNPLHADVCISGHFPILKHYGLLRFTSKKITISSFHTISFMAADTLVT